MTAVVEKERNEGKRSRRGAIRTALVLAAIVALIYLTFVGRAAFQYFSA